MPLPRLALTGSNGFIGSTLVKQCHGRFDVVPLVRSHIAGPGAKPDLPDVAGLAAAMQGCDLLVHCAHDAEHEASNLDRLHRLLAASKAAGVPTVVVLGSFVSHDGVFTAAIREDGSSSPFLFPYVVSKQVAVTACRRHAAETPGQRLIVLEPGIVDGAGGSWNRFAAKLKSFERIALPLAGEGLCHRIDVEHVAGAIVACWDRARSPGAGFERFVLTDQHAPTWREWLESREAGLAGRIVPSNRHLLSARTARNTLLDAKYRLLPALRERRWPRGSAANYQQAGRFATEAGAQGTYSAEGLDRLSFFCTARVDTQKARLAGLLGT